MIAELQHRSRNLLEVVVGIAVQTLAVSRSRHEFADSFHQRLAALGRVQGLLSHEIEPNVPLAEIVRLELAAHGMDGASDRIRPSRPGVALPARAVQLVALALHELMANAMKYGALRASAGARVAIAWDEKSDDHGRGHQG